MAKEKHIGLVLGFPEVNEARSEIVCVAQKKEQSRKNKGVASRCGMRRQQKRLDSLYNDYMYGVPFSSKEIMYGLAALMISVTVTIINRFGIYL